jgi:hypothetical protein
MINYYKKGKSFHIQAQGVLYTYSYAFKCINNLTYSYLTSENHNECIL